MTWVDITNLRGPRGQDGKDGEQGPAGPVNIGLNPAEPIVWDQAGGFTFNLIDGSQQTVNLPIASAQSAGLLGPGGQLPRTGQRDITSLVTSGEVVSGALLLERSGPHVVLTMDALRVSYSGWRKAFDLPVGFRPNTTRSKQTTLAYPSGEPLFVDAYGTGPFWIQHAKLQTDDMREVFSWVTDDPWPAVLPGT